MPCGEAIGFYPNGTGLHCRYNGLVCEETYFEWQPDGDFRIRVRLLDSANHEGESTCEEAGSDSDDWKSVPYSVIPGTSAYGHAALQLRAVFGPLLAMEPLWYEGERGQGPTSNWPRSAPERATRARRELPTWLLVLISCLVVGCYAALAALWSWLRLK
jgi:hypothetical protein